MKIFKNLLVCIILFFNCWSSQNSDNQPNNIHNNPFYQYVKKYNKNEIDSIINNNDTTIIVAWTEWCIGGQDRFKNLIPVVNGKSDNIGFISIYCGDKGKLVNILAENDFKFPVYLLSNSLGGIDKVRFNRLFSGLLKNYKSVYYVPVVIICNSQKQVLNRDTMVQVNYETNNGVAYYTILNLVR